MAQPNSTDDNAPVLLTVADIARLKAEYEADVRLLEELPARIKQRRRRYEAALLFAPPGFDPNSLNAPQAQAAAPAPVREPVAAPSFELASPPTSSQEDMAEEETGPGRLTWIGEVERVLIEAGRGLAHQQVLDILKATELGDRMSAGGKGFYNAVARLEHQGRLVKAGGLLYAAKTVDDMVARGEALPDNTAEVRRRAGGSSSAVLEVLREHPSGLDVTQLREAVSKRPGVPESITKHSHYIYNVLSTLMGQGAIEKQGEIYRIKGGASQ